MVGIDRCRTHILYQPRSFSTKFNFLVTMGKINFVFHRCKNWENGFGFETFNLIAVRTQRVKVHEITLKNIWIHFEESGNNQKLEAVLLPEFHWNFLQEKLCEDPFWCPWHAKSDEIQSFKRDSMSNKCFYCNNKLWLCFCKEAANTIIFHGSRISSNFHWCLIFVATWFCRYVI